MTDTWRELRQTMSTYLFDTQQLSFSTECVLTLPTSDTANPAVFDNQALRFA